ncbi:MAG: DUF4249 domain-containing protein [Bacteroidia bacterium]
MKQIPIYLLLATIVSLFACQTTLDIPLPPHEPKLVLNAFLEPGEPLDLYLTRSYGPLEVPTIEELLISDADVSVSIDGQDVGEMVYRDTAFFPGATDDNVSGKYFNSIRPQSGQEIQVIVVHPDYPTIEASTRIPAPINIVDASIDQYIIREIFPDGSGRFQSILNLTISDPAGETNYYVVDADIEYEDPDFPGQALRALANVQGVARLGEEGVYTTDGTLFGDQDFDGQTETIQLLCELPNSYNDPGLIKNLDIKKIFVYALSVSEGYARYQLKFQDQQGGLGGINILQAEPVIVYSNVENGHGILGSSVASLDTISQ